MEKKKTKKDDRTFQGAPDFKSACNVRYDGKGGTAKLTIPALAEIMKQLGTPPRIFTIPIALKVQDIPLENTIWISPDIAAAIEEHMTEHKQKDKGIKLAADVADEMK